MHSCYVITTLCITSFVYQQVGAVFYVSLFINSTMYFSFVFWDVTITFGILFTQKNKKHLLSSHCTTWT